ncbi:MAG: hypothetical protein EAZ91_03510 [Cytophagales bacterium]|nr:MAG: hypothetical protein EAZ91_03510 [Cytophagales bacterium]
MKIPAPLLYLQGQNVLTNAFQIVFSPEGIQAFEEMANSDFPITWSELSREEAQALLFIWQVSDAMRSTLSSESSTVLPVLTLLPAVFIQASANILSKLTPYVPLLQQIASGEVTPFEAKILGGDIELRQGNRKVYTIDQLQHLTADAA